VPQKQRDDMGGPWKFLGCKCTTLSPTLAKKKNHLFTNINQKQKNKINNIMINVTYMYYK